MILLALFSFYILFCLPINACNCTARNDSEVYCSSQFVAQITVESAKFFNETSSGKNSKGKRFEVHEYVVKFDKVYKKDKHFDAIEKSKKIYSSAREGGCGVEFDISKDAKKNQYLIGGYIAKEKAYIHKCGWAKNFDTVDKDVKAKLEKNGFDSDCPDKVIQKDNEERKKWRKELFKKSNRTEVEHNKNNTKVTKPPKSTLN